MSRFKTEETDYAQANLYGNLALRPTTLFRDPQIYPFFRTPDYENLYFYTPEGVGLYYQ